MLHQIPARCIGGCLGILVVIEHTDHHLNMPLGLHVAAHHTKAHNRFSVFGDESGYDGLVRSFIAGDLIRMSFLKRKSEAAILKTDPGSGDNNAGAETHIVRLNKRNHHTVCIRSRQIDRPPVCADNLCLW